MALRVLNGCPDSSLHEVVKVKPDAVGDAEAMGYQPRRGTDRIWNQPKREKDKCVHHA